MVHEIVRGYISRHALLRAGDRVAVAVSGGADSVALLRILLELRAQIGLVLSVAHFDHQVRGAESAADADFVRALAEQHGLEFHFTGGDALEHSRATSSSLETAGRELRYAFFSRLLQDGRVNRIATAHTQDDQAETVLMRLVRGAHTRGLGGIHPKRALRADEGAHEVRGAGAREVPHKSPDDCTIVRPMLEVRRTAVEEYLRASGQSWREDATNADVHHLRNRIRRELLPMLARDYNPAIVAALCRLADVSRGEEDFWRSELMPLLPTIVTPGMPVRGGGRDSGGPSRSGSRFRSGSRPDFRTDSQSEPRNDLRNDSPNDSPNDWPNDSRTDPRPDLPTTSFALQLEKLKGMKLAALRRLVVYACGEYGIELVSEHVDRVLDVAEKRMKACELPGGWRVSRSFRELQFSRKN